MRPEPVRKDGQRMGAECDALRLLPFEWRYLVVIRVLEVEELIEMVSLVKCLQANHLVRAAPSRIEQLSDFCHSESAVLNVLQLARARGGHLSA